MISGWNVGAVWEWQCQKPPGQDSEEAMALVSVRLGWGGLRTARVWGHDAWASGSVSAAPGRRPLLAVQRSRPRWHSPVGGLKGVYRPLRQASG